MKTRKFCPKCGCPVVKSRTEGYAFQCHACDEDFYRFEVLTTRQIEQVREIRRIAYQWEIKNDYTPQSFKKPYPAPKRRCNFRREPETPKLVEGENGSELCYCNNCGCYLIDNNPQFGAQKYDTEIASGELEQFSEPADGESPDNEEYFWGCPNCETDGYLIDV
jgi:putative DNA-directed RNA polymerase, subunit M